MTEPMLPVRDAVCTSYVSDSAAPAPHHPVSSTVESGYNVEMEWQFGVCAYCRDSISRFRHLLGGRWFDRWGSIHGSAYFFEYHGTIG